MTELLKIRELMTPFVVVPLNVTVEPLAKLTTLVSVRPLMPANSVPPLKFNAPVPRAVALPTTRTAVAVNCVAKALVGFAFGKNSVCVPAKIRPVLLLPTIVPRIVVPPVLLTVSVFAPLSVTVLPNAIGVFPPTMNEAATSKTTGLGMTTETLADSVPVAAPVKTACCPSRPWHCCCQAEACPRLCRTLPVNVLAAANSTVPPTPLTVIRRVVGQPSN